MESANLHRHLHHQQLQENLNTSHAAVGGSSSSSSSSSLAPRESYYGIKHANWTQHHPTTHDHHHLSNLSNSSFNSSNMVPDLGIHCSWPPPISNLMNTCGGGGGGSSNIKEELSSSSSDSTFPKFTQMLTSNSTTSLNMVVDDDDYHFSGPTSLTSLSLMKNDQHKEMMMNDLSEKLLLKTLSSSSTSSGINSSPGDHLFYTSATAASNNNHVPNFTQLLPGRSGGHCFSQIYPSINISNLNQHQQSSSSSLSSPSAISSCSSNLDINLQAMDLLASSGFSSTQPPSNSLLLDHHHHQEIRNSFGHLQHMYQSTTHHDHDHHSLLSRGADFNSKMPSFENNEVTDQVKRRPAGSLIETKATQAGAAPKKSRLESRTPCPPFKVRKEKLGDRIASLQQLVAPFGKTDTASVLMEAIGYIKFLQNQVETLSVPYMKSSRNNKPSKTMFQGGVVEMNGGINGDRERQRDLRSRGLCLVPLSCMSYVTAGTHDVTTTAATGSVNWPSPNYGGTS